MGRDENNYYGLCRNEEHDLFWKRVATGESVTLHQWITYGDNDWPKGSDGFYIGERGRYVWGGAYYPDACSGNWVTVYRGHPAILARYDRDTEMRFAWKPCSRCEQKRGPQQSGEGAPWTGRLICRECVEAIQHEQAPKE